MSQAPEDRESPYSPGLTDSNAEEVFSDGKGEKAAENTVLEMTGTEFRDCPL